MIIPKNKKIGRNTNIHETYSYPFLQIILRTHVQNTTNTRLINETIKLSIKSNNPKIMENMENAKYILEGRHHFEKFILSIYNIL
jgi:hypothetical protein